MDASGDIRRKQLEDIERRIDAHPGLVEHLRLGAFAQSLGAVFLPNWRELLALLDRAANDGCFGHGARSERSSSHRA